MRVRFGAFGKMPAFGDFFRIAPPPGFVEPWDRWLQHGITVARDRLGPRWSGLYLSAPIWRFSLAAGLAGPQPVCGVLMPSVDRVGRQFPLTLMAAIGAPHRGFDDQAAASATFDQLEEVALAALDDDAMTREALAARLAGIAPPPPLAPATGPHPPPPHRASLWSALVGEGAFITMACAALPDPGEFTRLIDIAPAGEPRMEARP